MSSATTIDELLVTHAAAIAALRAAVPEIPPHSAECTDWDDLWLLRWVLSFPKSETDRAAALREAIAWRAEHSQILADAIAGRPAPFADKLARFNVVGFHGQTKLGEPLFIVRAGLSNPSIVMDHCTPDEVFLNMVHSREIGFRICERETRQRRVITKMISGSRIGIANLEIRQPMTVI